MPLLTWLAIKFFPDPASGLTITLNSFVHVTMYTYYLLAQDPKHKTLAAWIKKYITTLQLVQFFILFAEGVQHLFIIKCLTTTKRNVTIFSFVLDLYFIYGFGKFYINSYLKKSSKEKTQ